MVPDVCELNVQPLKTNTGHVHEPCGIRVVAQILDRTEDIGHGEAQTLFLRLWLQCFLRLGGGSVTGHAAQKRSRQWLAIEGIHRCLAGSFCVLDETHSGCYVHDVALALAVHEAHHGPQGDLGDRIRAEEVERVVGLSSVPEQRAGATCEVETPRTEDRGASSGNRLCTGWITALWNLLRR
jgi:hypothetical protein